VLAGLVLAGLAAWWRERRVPWRVLALLGGLLAATVVGLRLFAGGGSGVLVPQPLALLGWIPPYAQTLGVGDGPAADGLLPPGVRAASGAGLMYVAGIIAWWFVVQAPRLLGAAILATRERHTDPIAWLLAGTTAAGTAAAWLFYHPSQSQVYFFMCVTPAGVLLTVWLLTDRPVTWRAPLTGFVAGTLWALVVPATSLPANRASWTAWAEVLARPLVWTLGAALAATAVALFFRPGRGALVAGAIAAVLGLSLGSGLADTTDRLIEHRSPFVAEPVEPRRIVTADEQRAALWLDAHAGADDVVATNVHCQPIGRPKPCDARAFWVSGLGGHRTVVESWGYSDETVAANGRGGLKFPLQPAPDPALKERNDRLFTAPTAADLAAFRAEFGVRWLFADARASVVSPDLAKLATVRHRSGPVTVYEVG
jgi:VanZ family protein